MIRKNSTSISESFVAGTYYIGDPCYAFPNDGEKAKLWDDWCTIMFNGSNEVKGWKKVFEFHGYKVATDSTVYGDGSYDGSDGRSYSVDSGTIGILPIEFVRSICEESDESLMRSGNIVTFDKPFIVTLDNGSFRFGHINIETEDRYDEEEEDWDSEYDD